MEAPIPLLVHLLGGNAVTAVSVLRCINTANATVLRRLHPVLAAAVEAVPWADTATPVHDTARWRAALPVATALKLAATAPLYCSRALTSLEGVTELNLARCYGVTDAVIAHLPPTLRVLNVSECMLVTQDASFVHLSALESLDCSNTEALDAGLTSLPPSLRTLRMYNCEFPDTLDFSHLCNLCVVTCGGGWYALSSASTASLPPSLEVLDVSDEWKNNDNNVWPPGWSLAHLTHLRELNASCTIIDDAALATLPPSLHVLNLRRCNSLTSGASFAHLPCLQTLSLRNTRSATLATLPPSLVSLDLNRYKMLTPTTVLPDLPALRELNVSYTGLGDAAVASMPAGLEELFMVCCSNVTQSASMDHLAALRELQSACTDLSRATIAACRARGCFAPADGKLALERGKVACCLVPLPDGRLVSGTKDGMATLREAPAGREAVGLAELKPPDVCHHAHGVPGYRRGMRWRRGWGGAGGGSRRSPTGGLSGRQAARGGCGRGCGCDNDCGASRGGEGGGGAPRRQGGQRGSGAQRAAVECGHGGVCCNAGRAHFSRYLTGGVGRWPPRKREF